MNNIMLDLETLGNKPGCVIVSIGAVRFGGGELGEEFYNRIDARDAVARGLKLDVDTVLWWLKQSDAAREELTRDDTWALEEALTNFKGYCTTRPRNENIIWGNGSDFDNAILKEAYEIIGLCEPWAFWNNRCYRTVKSLHPEIKLEISAEKKHNALEDAKAQARHLMAMLPGI